MIPIFVVYGSVVGDIDAIQRWRSQDMFPTCSLTSDSSFVESTRILVMFLLLGVIEDDAESCDEESVGYILKNVVGQGD